jgi:hypothetical protein
MDSLAQETGRPRFRFSSQRIRFFERGMQMLRTLLGAGVAVLLAASPAGAVSPTSAKVRLGMSAPPQEVKEPIRQLLGERTVQVLDDQGKVAYEIWFRKEIPVKATAEDLEKGIRYSRLPQSVVLGAIRLGETWSDFRRQRVRPGVYTLRLGFQPMDGDHMGTAPFNEFCLLIPAASDTSPNPMEFKKMFELACKAAGSSHAAIMMLYPNYQPGEAPELVNKGGGNYVLNWKEDLTADGQKGVLGIGLTLFGATTAE